MDFMAILNFNSQRELSIYLSHHKCIKPDRNIREINSALPWKSWFCVFYLAPLSTPLIHVIIKNYSNNSNNQAMKLSRISCMALKLRSHWRTKIRIQLLSGKVIWEMNLFAKIDILKEVSHVQIFQEKLVGWVIDEASAIKNNNRIKG